MPVRFSAMLVAEGLRHRPEGGGSFHALFRSSFRRKPRNPALKLHANGTRMDGLHPYRAWRFDRELAPRVLRTPHEGTQSVWQRRFGPAAKTLAALDRPIQGHIPARLAAVSE